MTRRWCALRTGGWGLAAGRPAGPARLAAPLAAGFIVALVHSHSRGVSVSVSATADCGPRTTRSARSPEAGASGFGRRVAAGPRRPWPCCCCCKSKRAAGCLAGCCCGTAADQRLQSAERRPPTSTPHPALLFFLASEATPPPPGIQGARWALPVLLCTAAGCGALASPRVGTPHHPSSIFH
jgi:hypothetical protein